MSVGKRGVEGFLGCEFMTGWETLQEERRGAFSKQLVGFRGLGCLNRVSIRFSLRFALCKSLRMVGQHGAYE